MRNEYRVLLVEDNKIAQRIPLLLLERWPGVIDVAESGQLALQMTQTHRYDLILMDIGLPDMSGIQTARTIRSTCEINGSTPIVALSAHEDEVFTDEAGINYFNATLQKPLTR